jgi:ribosomal protein S27AE
MEIPSEFCTHCGQYMLMPIYGDTIQCKKCGAEFALADYDPKPIESEIVFN